MKAIVSAGVSGLLFGCGLVVGQMTIPAKVIGFLDFFGAWDPSLLWVMVGAIAVHLPLRYLLGRRSRPLFVQSFSVLPRRRVDGQLVLGAAVFGIGWGLGGYCPAPAIATSTCTTTGLLALLAIGGGIVLHDIVMSNSRRELPLRASGDRVPQT